jgi:hypothetical protein
MISEQELRLIYGNDISISRKGPFLLLHLDRPSESILLERTTEFDPDRFFCENCPLCQIVRESGVVIFNDGILEGDEFIED